jgi:23S rRNA (pseudouridine1915-N3)-methyltransferase
VKVTLLAVGRLGRASEAMLAKDYAERATAAGRALGLGPVEILEVESKKPGKEAEADALLAALPDGAHLIA